MMAVALCHRKCFPDAHSRSYLWLQTDALGIPLAADMKELYHRGQ